MCNRGDISVIQSKIMDTVLQCPYSHIMCKGMRRLSMKRSTPKEMWTGDSALCIVVHHVQWGGTSQYKAINPEEKFDVSNKLHIMFKVTDWGHLCTDRPTLKRWMS